MLLFVTSHAPEREREGRALQHLRGIDFNISELPRTSWRLRLACSDALLCLNNPLFPNDQLVEIFQINCPWDPHSGLDRNKKETCDWLLD